MKPKQAAKHTPGILGSSNKCPRCLGPKPLGDCGNGIALSRRGRAAICSQCGTEEAMLDSGMIARSFTMGKYEDRLKQALEKREGK